MSVKAFSQISITDLTDIGTLQFYINSNMPSSTIYNPNTGMYTPDWSSEPLELTPVIFFDSKVIELTSSALAIEWTRREGALGETALTTGETVTNGKLVVSANVLATNTYNLLTYIAHVSYTDPNSGVTLTSVNQMTFNLVKHAEELKYCSISGEGVFLYNTNQELITNPKITLTANLTNVDVVQWQYKDSAGNFAAFPTTNNTVINGSTIDVYASEDILFNNDICVVKLVTSSATVFDVVTITKLRDGAAGGNSVVAVLSNDSCTIPCSSDGTVLSYNGADTKISVYLGGIEETSDWTIVVTKGTEIDGTWNDATHTFVVTSLTCDSSYVEFSCSKDGYSTITKRFTILKGRSGTAGADAVVYSVDSSVPVIVKNSSDVFTPTSVVFFATKQVGASVTKTAYNGRFKIYESTDGTTFTLITTTSTDATSYTHAPSSTSVKIIKCELYAEGGTVSLLDTQSVAITSDGKDGENGNPGPGGTSVIVGNESELINCTNDGLVSSAMDWNIPFYGYKGIARADCTCTVGTLPSGMSVKSNTSATTSAGGTLIISITAGSNLGGNDSGDIILTFTCNDTSITKRISFAKVKAAINGENAVLLQIFAPQGDVIINSSNNVILETQLTNGGQIVTGSTYQWQKFENGDYGAVLDTTSTLTVTPDMVDSFASFKCTTTYNGESYVAYWCVTDKSDPYVLERFCTFGEQIVNGEGVGAIYCRIFRNGEEIDPIKTTTFLQNAPSSANSGDFYYHLDSNAKTVTLKKYNGTSWVNATGDDLSIGWTYKYYRRDKDGNLLDTSTPWQTGKAIYIDGSMIDKKIIIDIEVESTN